uniref:Uncharacterized protein n=1 Tax=Oryza glumipatula TaxID=40148 RepID=A0A0D9Z912_9ORYZ
PTPSPTRSRTDLYHYTSFYTHTVQYYTSPHPLSLSPSRSPSPANSRSPPRRAPTPSPPVRARATSPRSDPVPAGSRSRHLPARRAPTAWRVRLRCRRREDSSAAAGGATGRAGPRPARAGSRTRPGPTLLPLISAAARVGSRRPATSPGSRSRSHPAPLPAPVRESWPTATGSSLPAPVRRSPGSTAATATARTWRRCSPVDVCLFSASTFKPLI